MCRVSPSRKRGPLANKVLTKRFMVLCVCVTTTVQRKISWQAQQSICTPNSPKLRRKLKSHNISFVLESFLNQHFLSTTALCAKFYNDHSTRMDVMRNRNFERFHLFFIMYNLKSCVESERAWRAQHWHFVTHMLSPLSWLMMGWHKVPGIFTSNCTKCSRFRFVNQIFLDF